MNTRSLLLLAACVVASPVVAPAADWPQWRGPERNDVSRETDLLKDWPNGGPKLLWTYRDGGAGFSGPAVVGDRLYTLGADDKSEYVFALDVKTGRRLWSAEVGPLFTNPYGDGPRGTPTVAGDLLYAIGGEGDLVCLKTSGGEKQWHKSLAADLDGGRPYWGYTESPLVDGDKMVCTPGGSKGTIAALDRKTGTVLWRSKDYKDSAAYASLVPATVAGVRQYVQMTGSSVAGVAADDGRLLWRYARSGPVAPVPTPIVSGDLVYATSGYGAGCQLIKLAAQGGKVKVEQVYSNHNMVNHHGGAVLVDGYVYGFSEGKGWICQDFKTGKIVWSEKNKLGKGSLTCAGGQLYCYSETGTLVLIDASPDGWKEHGRFEIPEKTRIEQKYSPDVWTHPVVANGHLYLRDQELIFCYDVKGVGTGGR